MMKSKKLIAIVLFGLFAIISGCEQTETDVPTTDRDKFIGTWDAQSDGTGGHRNFSLTITASNSAPDQIRLQNFDGGSGSVFANVSGSSLSIPSQNDGTDLIQGSGSLSGGTIHLTYSIDDGQTVENRTGTATNKH